MAAEAMSVTPVLKAENLSAGYTPGAPYVQGVTVAVRPGEIVAFLGPNGAGKSTVLRTLAGLLAPLAGQVTVLGTDLAKMAPEARARTLSVALTDRVSLPTATAWEIAALGRSPHTGFFGALTERDRAVVAECLGAVAATDLAHRRFASLSDGEKQKVLIARALAQEPKVLILDEPLSFLDIKHKLEVAAILRVLSEERGLAVVLALHDIEIAAKYCHSVVLMRSGRVISQGTPEAVLQGDAVDSLYGITGPGYAELLGGVVAVLKGKGGGE
jgi:iron complex transport system ATP-binding protein